MATAKHTLPLRRKREGKTNYKKRLALLKSGQIRLVIRRTNRHLLLQLVDYHPDGDKVILSFDSKTLHKHGWKFSTKSIPAAYFSGVLFAKKAKEKKIASAIIDLGLEKHIAGSRLCAAIKGAIDGGLSIPTSEKIFPPGNRLHGLHISDAAGKEVAAFSTKLGVTLPEVKKPEAKPAKKPEQKPPAKPPKNPKTEQGE